MKRYNEGLKCKCISTLFPVETLNVAVCQELGTKVSLSDLCRLFSSILRVLRTNTGQYLTEKPVKWAETGGAKMVAGLLSQAPRLIIKGF